jgi:hypothetical protein
MNSSWLTNASANRLKQSYVQGFVDVSGNAIIRNGSVNIRTGKLFLPQGDISMNGNIISSGGILLGTNTGTSSGYQMTVSGNARIRNSILVENDASVMSSLGVGKASNDTYPLDVSGVAWFSSSVSIGGATTITNASVTGTSTLTGNVGIGAAPSSDNKIFINGQSRVYGQALFDNSIAVGPNIRRDTDIAGSTLLVKVPISSTAANDVILNVPTTLYTSTDGALTNKLVIDTKNHVIKPSTENNGIPVTDVADGWDLGATGTNSFNRVYGCTLEVSRNIGIGKSSDAGYAIDVSGPTRLSSSLMVVGATTLGSIANVTGTSRFSGGVGIGKAPTSTNALDVNGNLMASGNTYISRSLVIGQTTPSTATLHVNASANNATNSVVFDAPNVLYRSASSSNPSQTNFLEIDAKTRSILPYSMSSDETLLNTASTSWNLGGTGAYRFNSIYARDLVISTNTINIEDDSGNKIGMSFDATTGAVNYTVTTISGEVFVIKGVQTQKVSSGSGTIDPAMLEFVGLAFGDTFTNDAYDLTSTFTYDLTSTTYTGNGTVFTSSAGAQSLVSFVSGTNLTTLLSLIATGTSVVIKVGATDGRSSNLEGIDVPGSLVSLAGKIISVKKTGTSTSNWTLWNSENYINVSGNFLHYVELKNINMTSGTYFIAKTTGSIVYNYIDQKYLNVTDLTTVSSDLYLYINRGPGNNWTKIPVTIPPTGTILTQNIADYAITTVKLADNSVTADKIVNGSITGYDFADNSITTAKIADGNITSSKLADGSITGTKLADGVIALTDMIADGIITGAKLVAGTIGESLLDTSSITTDKLASGAITADKLSDSSVGNSKIIDGAITNSKMAINSVSGSNIIAGSITGDKITSFSITGDNLLDGTITAVKLAPGAINSSLIDASSITVDKIASGSIETPKLANLSITSGKLAASSVTAAKISSGAVTSDKLAGDSVNTVNLVNGAITTVKLTDLVVTSDQMANAVITTGKIVDLAVTYAKLNTDSVTVDKIISSSVTSAKIADGAVTTSKLANSAVGTGQIAAAAITTTKLATGAVVSANIGSLEVLTSKIADGAVTTAKIAAGAVNSSALGASVVDTSNIATGIVTAEKIAAGAISTTQIADGAITAAKFYNSSVTTSIIADGSITGSKFASGFKLPSTAGGGGASIDPTSDIGMNILATGGNQIPTSLQQIDLSAKVITADFLKLNAGAVDTMPGVDMTLGATYGLKNTGTFLNNGIILISDVAAPTLKLRGDSATGHVIEFRTTSLTNDWGAANEWRWRLDAYNGKQSMVLQKGGTTNNIISMNEEECCFSSPITSMSTNVLKLGPGGGGYYSGYLSISNIGGSNSSISIGASMEDSDKIAFLVNRSSTTSSLWNNAIQSQNDFEIHTGRAVNTVLTNNSVFVSNRRLHVGYGGDVGIGTSYVNESKLTIGGNLDVTGDVNAISYGHSVPYTLSLTNILVKSGTSSEMGVATSGRVAMNSDGTVSVSSSVLSKSIYVYRLVNGSWESSPSSTITRTETNFGLYFALSRNGLKIATSDGTTIWMYIWNSGTSAWVLQTQTIINGTGIAYGTGFVKNMKLSSDGSKIAIISYSSASVSKIYIYDTVTGTLLVTMNPYADSTVTMDIGAFADWSNASTATGEWTRFRIEFSSDASTLVTGNTQASSATGVFIIYDINYTTNTTTNKVILGSTILNNSNCKLGRRFSINANGTVIAVAAKRFDMYGGPYSTDTEKFNASIMIYTRTLGSGPGGWSRIKQIYDYIVPDFGNIDNYLWSNFGFGADICLSDDGNVIYISTVTETHAISGVGPTTAGKIVRSNFSGGSWSSPTVVATGTSTSFFGYGLATNSDGSKLAVSEFKGTSGTPHGGKLYMYTTNSIDALTLNSNGPLIMNAGSVTGRVYSSETTTRTFTHSGGAENQTTHTFTVDQKVAFDILIVGGGGGGAAGGGGGGAYIYFSDVNLGIGTYTISVGNGGTGAIGSTSATQGFNSSVVGGSVNYIAYGGGGGAGNGVVAPAHITGQVGSYGGNGHDFTTIQTYTSVQGNRGGRSLVNPCGSGGGGGGAGAVGADSVSVPGLVHNGSYIYHRGGYGGNGLPNNISGSTVYYAGGGTGGANTNTDTDTSTQVAVLGGGGLGARAPNANGTNGTNGLGGGGGGGEWERTAGTRGGSGIVIIKIKPYTEQIVSSNTGISVAATSEVGIGTSPVTGTKLTVSGNATITGTLTTSSDDRLKDNEVLLTNATDTLLKLRPEIYDKKPDFTSTDPSKWRKESGLIAQDIWYGAPELRHLVKPVNPSEIAEIQLASDIQQDPNYTALGWGDTPASVNYTGLIPYLIKSIQELKAKLNALN